MLPHERRSAFNRAFVGSPPPPRRKKGRGRRGTKAGGFFHEREDEDPGGGGGGLRGAMFGGGAGKMPLGGEGRRRRGKEERVGRKKRGFQVERERVTRPVHSVPDNIQTNTMYCVQDLTANCRIQWPKRFFRTKPHAGGKVQAGGKISPPPLSLSLFSHQFRISPRPPTHAISPPFSLPFAAAEARQAEYLNRAQGFHLSTKSPLLDGRYISAIFLLGHTLQKKPPPYT